MRKALLRWFCLLVVVASATLLNSVRCLAEDSLIKIEPKPLPDKIVLEENLPVRQLYSPVAKWSSGKVIKLEARYNENVTLEDVLKHALNYNLPIKISKESWGFQRGQLYAKLAGFVPSYSLSYGNTAVKVLPVTRSREQVFISEVRYPVFVGGSVVYSALGQYYRDKAFRNAFYSTIDDNLLKVYNQYTNLVLQDTLMGIRARSVELSEANLDLIESIYKAGANTQLNVMQSRAKLGQDKELYLRQQLSRRNAALGLSFLLNMPMAANLLPSVDSLHVRDILSDRFTIDDYIELALANRPELRQYEAFRLAAARNVPIAASSLYPTFSWFTAYTAANTSLNIPENETLLNGVAAAEVAAAEENIGVVTNTALDQTASFSPGGSNTGNQGANAYASVVAGGGGNPIANVQGGSLVTSGAVKPQFGSSTITGAPTSSNISGADTAGAGVFPGRSYNWQGGFNLGWSLSNMGLSTVAGIQASRALSRQAMLQANKELQLVLKQVRDAYIKTMVAKRRVRAAALASATGKESLRLARLSLKAGLGKNIELIAAQNAYIKALSQQAQAITALNKSQAQLLRDTGVISVEYLLDGLNEIPTSKQVRRKRISSVN